MNKGIVFSVVVLMGSVSFAGPIMNKAAKIENLSQQISILAEDVELGNTPRRSTAKLNRKLNRLLKVAQRMQDALGTGGGQRPVPVPPAPAPVVVCSSDYQSVYQAAFVKVKDFAYQSSGMDLSSTAARNFATNWANEYPCDYADMYIKNYKRLKKFAYQSSGLDMSSTSARNYAKANVNKLCMDYPLEKEFKAAYDFAYSSRGLDYSSTRARKYAREKVEPMALACQNI